MFTLMSLLYVLTMVAAGILVIMLFLRTRNGGYLVIGAAFLLWPAVTAMFHMMMRSNIGMLVRPGTYPFNGLMTPGCAFATIASVGRVIQGLLIVVGLLLLNRKGPAVVTPPPGPPANGTAV